MSWVGICRRHLWWCHAWHPFCGDWWARLTVFCSVFGIMGRVAATVTDLRGDHARVSHAYCSSASHRSHPPLSHLPEPGTLESVALVTSRPAMGQYGSTISPTVPQTLLPPSSSPGTGYGFIGTVPVTTTSVTPTPLATADSIRLDGIDPVTSTSAYSSEAGTAHLVGRVRGDAGFAVRQYGTSRPVRVDPQTSAGCVVPAETHAGSAFPRVLGILLRSVYCCQDT